MARTFRFRAFRFRTFRTAFGRGVRGAAPLVALECCVCGRRSEFAGDPEQAGRWGLAHLESHPDHGTYRTLTAVPARVRSP